MDNCEHANEHTAPTKRGDKAGVSVGVELGGVAVFASAAAYGLGYAAQAAFYRQFGLTPEQAGVDPLTALLRVTPLAVLAGLGSIISFTMILALGIWIQREFVPGRWRSRLSPLVITPTVVFGGAMLLVWQNPPKLSAAAVGPQNLTEMLVTFSLAWLSLLATWAAFRMTVNSSVGLAMAAVLGIVFVGAGLMSWVEPAAKNLSEKGEYSAVLALVGIPPGFAEVRWYDRGRHPGIIGDDQRLYLVLNQVGGKYFLYDCARRRVFTAVDAEAQVDRVLGPDQGESSVAWPQSRLRCQP